ANAILSPADGRIVAVEQVRDPYADRDALKISVFMNVFNVHSNRAPVDGTVQQVQYFPGKFVNADLDKASRGDEPNAIGWRRAAGRLAAPVPVAG
ncbi:phosphatidylserine decarboxylase, partial [Mycobacterium tuberculosis]|nr:phosphatidylserine decarboxylase [Mycobacterium tuberculosis]